MQQYCTIHAGEPEGYVMPTTTELIAAVREAFATARPGQFISYSPLAAEWGDDEGALAEAMFASRTPDSLRSTDVGIGAGWPELFLTQSARDYYIPGFVRLILEEDDDNGFELDDFLGILAPDYIATMRRTQKLTLADVLEFIRRQLDERNKELVDRRLRRLRS